MESGKYVFSILIGIISGLAMVAVTNWLGRMIGIYLFNH